MVYFIQAGHDGPIKIGCSNRNFEKRLKQLQTGSHKELIVLGIMEGGLFEEKKLHEKFKAYHLRGEWFKPSIELKSFIVDNLGGEPMHKFEKKIIRGGIKLENILDDIRIKYIRFALSFTSGNITNAANLLGITFRSLRYQIKKYNI